MAGDSTLRIRPGAPGRLWHNAIRIYHVRPAIVLPPRRPRLWTRPDPASARAGREGELLAARVRIGCAADLGLIISGSPLAVTNGRTIFSIYLLALAFTCLRQDARMCVTAGLSAIFQYGALVAWVVAR